MQVQLSGCGRIKKGHQHPKVLMTKSVLQRREELPDGYIEQARLLHDLGAGQQLGHTGSQRLLGYLIGDTP